MRWRVLFVLLLLVDCGGGNQLAQDLRSAESACEQGWPSKSALVACLNDEDRRVWASEQPSTLDLYDSFARRRQALASTYDQGLMSEDQYLQRLRQLKDETRSEMEARRTGNSGE